MPSRLLQESWDRIQLLDSTRAWLGIGVGIAVLRLETLKGGAASLAPGTQQGLNSTQLELLLLSQLGQGQAATPVEFTKWQQKGGDWVVNRSVCEDLELTERVASLFGQRLEGAVKKLEVLSACHADPQLQRQC